MGNGLSTRKRSSGRKKRNSLRVVRVEYVQVPDSEERLGRVFRILLSHQVESKPQDDNAATTGFCRSMKGEFNDQAM